MSAHPERTTTMPTDPTDYDLLTTSQAEAAAFLEEQEHRAEEAASACDHRGEALVTRKTTGHLGDGATAGELEALCPACGYLVVAGASVRITIEAGVMRDYERGGRFDGSVPPGTIGTYFGPHPNPRLEGWLLVKVNPVRVEGLDLDDRYPEADLFAPLHPAHLEAVR